MLHYPESYCQGEEKVTKLRKKVTKSVTKLRKKVTKSVTKSNKKVTK